MTEDVPLPATATVETTGVPVTPSAPVRDDPPASWTEFASLLAIVLLADTSIYRGKGYGGWAMMLAATPALLFLGAARRRPGASVAVLGTMLILAAAKLIWCGSVLATVIGTSLLPFYAMSLAGRRPYVLDGAAFTASLIAQGRRGLASYGRSGLEFGRRFAPSSVIIVALSAVIGVAFSLLFVLANPDLVKSGSQTLSRLIEDIRTWLGQISVAETLFVLGVAWIAVGLLRPTFNTVRERIAGDIAEPSDSEPTEVAPRALFLAWRNTLVVVILVYAVYLTFEFYTLWFRAFPKGFYYSGYAHEGAVWLTIGLALATSILSLIFRGRILRD